jgi:FKBP-type peptidyl-prolyl cis-trans isomerase
MLHHTVCSKLHAKPEDGARSAGGVIPPALLIFEVELLGV